MPRSITAMLLDPAGTLRFRSPTMPSWRCHRLRGGAGIAGEHDDADALRGAAAASAAGVVALIGSAIAIRPASVPVRSRRGPPTRRPGAAARHRQQAHPSRRPARPAKRRALVRSASMVSAPICRARPRPPCRRRSRRRRRAPACVSRRAVAASTIARGKRVLARALERSAARRRRSLSEWRRGRHESTTTLRPAFGQRAGLVHHQRARPSPCVRAPRRSAPGCTPGHAPRPTPTMIDIGVARPSAHGHAMISTVTAATMP